MAVKNRFGQKRIRDDRKQKILSLDKNTQKMVTERMQIRPGALTKVAMELISAIENIAITGSAMYERRRAKVTRTVKTLDQLTAALCSEGFNL